MSAEQLEPLDQDSDLLAKEFGQLTEARLQELGDLLPLDLRPKGLVSTRYDFDGTGIADD